VMANNTNTKTDEFELGDGDYTRPELTAGPESEGRTERDGI
jgi:hypothetical protein